MQRRWRKQGVHEKFQAAVAMEDERSCAHSMCQKLPDAWMRDMVDDKRS